jgi:hypothetical protein
MSHFSSRFWHFSFRVSFWTFIFVLSCNVLQAQSAQAAAADDQTEASQQELLQPLRRASQPTIDPAAPIKMLLTRSSESDSPTEASPWDQMLASKMAPQRPQRPIPAILGLIGAALILIWSGLLIGTIVTTGTVGLILLISTLVLSPILVFGIVFVIGALVAAFSGGEKKQKKAVKTAPEPAQE